MLAARTPEGPTPEPNDTRERALKRLDERLDAFEARRAAPSGPLGEARVAGEGYRLVAGLIGGVLGGVGLGWFLDRVAHTSPIGLICGLLIGAVVSIAGAVASALRMSARAAEKSGPIPAASDAEDGD